MSHLSGSGKFSDESRVLCSSLLVSSYIFYMKIAKLKCFTTLLVISRYSPENEIVTCKNECKAR